MISSASSLAALAAELFASRRTVLPRKLTAPGPDVTAMRMIFDAAACAPDHGQLVPWRFIVVPENARAAFGEVFAQALVARDAAATAAQLAQAREKAMRAPCLMLAVVKSAGGGTSIPLHERMISAGCALQNMLLMANALGFGSALTSGKALTDPGLRRFFGLGADEYAACFVNIGTVQSPPRARFRPAPSQFVSTLDVGTDESARAQIFKASQ